MVVAKCRRLLVVDDEPAIRKLVRAALQPDYQVIEADDGVHALERLSQGGIDIVLLDVRMPRMDGLATCRAIKASSTGLFLPVILLTALTDQDDRNAGLLAGADDFLSKPIDWVELTLRVRTLLRLREQEERIRDHVADLETKEMLLRSQLERVLELQELKDDLFSLIVHDLRNPLTGVLGFLEILREGLKDPALGGLRRTAGRAFEAAQKLEALLEGVLEVKCLEAGAGPLKLTASCPGEIVREAARTLEGAAAAKHIEIEAVYDDVEFELLCDPALIRRAVENLLANALKFSPSNERISLSARRAGSNLLLEVADVGPGVSESGKMQLFKKFATGTSSGGVRRGFGLGLHLVKLVATAHGGDVIIRDREGGGGSVFGLRLPCAG